jgi:hypothetical protein
MSGQVRRVWPALVASVLATLLAGCVSQHTADQVDRRAVLGGLTRAEFTTAQHVAQRETAREDAEVTTASAGVVTPRRRALLGVHGHACPPGELIHVRLVGTFPRAHLEGSDGQVGGEDLVADPATGRVCAHSWLDARIVTDLSMVRLFNR